MKKTLLFGYDYGTGGLYEFISARSEQEVLEKYPFLVPIQKWPWPGSEEYFRSLCERGPFDIDAEPPEWIKIAAKKHQESRRPTGRTT